MRKTEHPPKQMERPVLFNREMVRAILDGRKTQTRRAIPLPVWASDATSVDNVGPWFHFNAVHPKGKCGEKKCGCIGSEKSKQPSMWTLHCPYGQPGDRLWVRETLKTHNHFGFPLGVCTQLQGYGGQRVWSYAADEIENPTGTRPSIHMPRWASRITLEITKIGVERLQEIHHNLHDLEAEGVTLSPSTLYPDCNRSDKLEQVYAKLWDSINGAGAWDKNPWVWCISFRRITLAS